MWGGNEWVGFVDLTDVYGWVRVDARLGGCLLLVARVIFMVGASEIYGRCVRWGFLCPLGYNGIVGAPLLERRRLKTKRLAVGLETW